MNITSRLLSLFLFSFVLNSPASCQSNQKTADAVLWEITGKELQQKSWIFGTIHMICPEEFYIFPGMEEAIEKADKVIIELDISDPMVNLEIQQSMFMTEGTLLEDFFEEEEYMRLKSFFKDSIDVDLSALSGIKPIFLSSMIYPHMIGCIPKSYEDYLVSKAKELDISIGALEDVQEQFDVFKHINYEKQAQLLLGYLDDYEEKKSEFKIMLSDYLKQKINKLLEDIESSSYEELDDFTRAMIRERNKRWIPRIERLINEQSVFIAVGAAHLPGEEGVIKLLQEKGYDLNPVKR